MEKIVGRKQEIRILQRLYQSNKAEFLAIYGRRRIGKTFLIHQFFKDTGIYFEVTGSRKASKAEQLANFYREFVALFKQETEIQKVPKSWDEAFHQLKEAISLIPSTQKVILFFDELPWLASPKSGFLSALDYFWNRHASRMPNVLMIVCGSAASWMIKKIIQDRGGLHGRLSAEIRLQPFSLGEVKEFLQEYHIHLTHKQIVEIYMVAGGVPKYLTYIERGHSSAQIINALCFMPQSPLLQEFHKLYDSLFEGAQKHVKIVRLLGEHRYGMRQLELFRTAGLSVGGRSQELLEELEVSGFISRSPHYGKNIKDRTCRLVDEYSLFYLTWIDATKHNLLRGSDKDHWNKLQMTPSWYAWAGYAFETICLQHIRKVKEALEIGGVSTNESHWHCNGAEIDLVIDRADQCINLCEMKFYNNVYKMTRKDAEDLERKKRLFYETTGTKKTIFITLITPYGAHENEHYLRIVDNQITLDALF